MGRVEERAIAVGVVMHLCFSRMGGGKELAFPGSRRSKMGVGEEPEWEW